MKKWILTTNAVYYGINNSRQYEIPEKKRFKSEVEAKDYMHSAYLKFLAGMRYVSRYGKNDYSHYSECHIGGCLNKDWMADWKAVLKRA